MTTSTAPATAAAPTTDIVYDVRGVTLTFGGVTSLSDLSLQMHRGEILAIIGPNGAGKTSLFNSLTGVYTPQQGSITVAARVGDAPTSVIYQQGLIFKKTRSRKTHVINHLGVARTFQNIRLFPALTALENVKVGVETRMKSGPVSAMLGLPRQRREERQATERSFELLRFVGLTDRANELAGSLAYGEQRRLEIARALGTDPGVILLDEPAAGTNPVEKRELADLIRKINEVDGISVLLIEHDMKLVMSIAHRLVVLNFGIKIAEGSPEQIQRDPAVVAAYLGTTEDDEPSAAPDDPKSSDPKPGGGS
jgi:branched-chain amino acid transport system ATP-binding protein